MSSSIGWTRDLWNRFYIWAFMPQKEGDRTYIDNLVTAVINGLAKETPNLANRTDRENREIKAEMIRVYRVLILPEKEGPTRIGLGEQCIDKVTKAVKKFFV